MGSYIDVININVGFEIENCIFLNMCTVVLSLSFSPCDAICHQQQSIPFDTGQYSNSARLFVSRIQYTFSSQLCARDVDELQANTENLCHILSE